MRILWLLLALFAIYFLVTLVADVVFFLNPWSRAIDRLTPMSPTFDAELAAIDQMQEKMRHFERRFAPWLL